MAMTATLAVYVLEGKPMDTIISRDADRLAGLQVDLLQKIRAGNISLDQLERFVRVELAPKKPAEHIIDLDAAPPSSRNGSSRKKTSFPAARRDSWSGIGKKSTSISPSTSRETSALKATSSARS